VTLPGSRRAIAAILVLVAGSAGIVLSAAAPASAASTCTFNKKKATVNVTLAPSGGGGLSAPSGTIELDSVPCVSSGGTTATVTNVDTIKVQGDATDQLLLISLENGPFAPGKTDESGTSDEIEWTVDLGAGDDDLLDIFASTGDDNITVGLHGVNLNAGESSPDTDVSVTGADEAAAFMETGNDTINGTGFGAPVEFHGQAGDDTVASGKAGGRIYGEEGNDTLIGGQGNDQITGGPGDDTMNGKGGDDNFFEDETPNGADTMTGGTGNDFALYYGRTAPLALDNDGAADDGDPTANGGAGEHDNIGTDVEQISGGTANDTITGGSGADHLSGLGGNDQIRGGAGADILDGGDGKDKFDALDGEVDTVLGGAGTDSCTCDPTDHQIDIP
jgi:Ca2+-binding RTX toxin-like protein